MDRKKELQDLVGDKVKADQLIDEIIFMEGQLKSLKELPFINVNPKNKMQQKATPAAKQYKEFMQQYNNCLRLLYRLSGQINGEDEEESPLRKWIKEKLKNE